MKTAELAGMGGADASLPEARRARQDAAFARALAGGEPQAAQEFIDRCLPTVLGVARRLLGDEAEAEDIAQETFVRVWRNASRWKPGHARFDTWVGRIAINLCYDRMRKRRERLVETAPDRCDEEADAAGLLECAESADAVRGALAALPERQRLALELCHFLEHSNIDAAEMMGVTVDALESLLARARRRLREALEEQRQGLMDGFAAVRRNEWL